MLITRPQADAERLAGLLSSIGVDSIVQPAQEFKPRTLGASELNRLATLEPPLLLIFTSPRAVELGLPQLPPSVLAAAMIAAIGPATARALKAAGKPVDIEPEEDYTSEALLDSLSNQPAQNGGTALVLCAPGGRDLLVEHLGKCGWKARPLWVYERRAADLRPGAVEAIGNAERLLSVFTSEQAINSLSQRLPPSAWYAICRGEWLVISKRLQRLARAFGPAEIHVANGPQNADLAAAIRSLV